MEQMKLGVKGATEKKIRRRIFFILFYIFFRLKNAGKHITVPNAGKRASGAKSGKT